MYQIYNFGLSNGLNPRLYERICENIIDLERGDDHIGGRSTSMDLHNRNIKEIDLLISWIRNILPEISIKFASRVKEDSYGYNINAFKIVDCWGVTYNKGESLREHCHFPFTLSFTYAVKLPHGSSSIFIENKKVQMKEGDCVFFLSSDYHKVKRNNCDGRCVIVGNILYSP